jgi:LmbE family N-acetylglucosaminyl deacetylase
MEVVECGGCLAKNVQAGGESHAALAFVSKEMRIDLQKSADILGVSLEYLDLDTAEISVSVEEKIKLVRAIRAFRPNIIVTQDPEHCIADFDPGRRPLMTLIFEAISLAGREFALQETAPHQPYSGATVYYMTPSRPNCLVDILSVWDKKCAAMDALETQLAFSAQYYEKNLTKSELAVLVPGWDELSSYLEKGIVAKREIDRATAMFYGVCGHSGTLLSEAYRKQELFELDNLIE